MGVNGEPLRVAMIVADERDVLGQWERPQPYFGTAPTALLEGLAGLEGLELHVVSCERRPVASTPKLAENVFFHPVPITRWSFLRSAYAGAILRVRRVLKRIRPHVVHGQGTERYQAMVAVYSGFPNVLTIHGNMRAVARAMGAGRLSFHGLTGSLEAHALRRCDGVLCLSSYTVREVRDLAPRTWLVPNAASSEFFNIAAEPHEPPAILCIGTICNYKNQNALIEGLDALAAKMPFRLRFAGTGGGAYGEEFQRLAAARPWCEVLGNLSRERIRAELAKCDLLAHPSLEDNCPMVVLEAMAAGVPVAGFRIGGMPDLVEDGVTGMLFDAGRMDALTDGIARILGDATLAQRLRDASRAQAGARFRPEAVARRHVEIYREIVAGGA